MLSKTDSTPRTRKIAGTLWLVAGVLCIAPRVLSDGMSGPSLAIGIMFIIFGIISFGASRTA